MKKVLFLFAVISCAAVNLFSIDFGGYIDNATSYSIDEATGFYQIDRIALWLNQGLGENGSFSVNGNYTYALDMPVSGDLDLLLLQYKWLLDGGDLSMLSLDLGRFAFTDPTGLVLDHNADGFRLGFSYPAAILSVGFGYTGLLFKHNTTITLSIGDSADRSDPDVWFAPGRMLGTIDCRFPDVAPGTDLWASLLFQKDLRSGDQIVEEGTEEPQLAGGFYDSVYAGTGLSGRMAPSLYYSAFAYVETGRSLTYEDDDESYTGKSYGYEPVLAFLAGFEISYYAESLSFSRIGLEAVFASGDEDAVSCVEGNIEGPSFLFTPISNRESFIVFDPALSNLFYMTASYQIKPLALAGYGMLDEVLALLSATAFFRPTTGVISETRGLVPDSDAVYLGTEIDFIINFRPFSDLGMSLGNGFFIPFTGSGGAFDSAERDFEYCIQFELSFSF
ncbi:MAG: hypothetical protein JW881_11335 [Spirochaetales bacterium]|nr:hypothetical protein [Spirochaetales bacterium]